MKKKKTKWKKKRKAKELEESFMGENPGVRNAWGTAGWNHSEILLFARRKHLWVECQVRAQRPLTAGMLPVALRPGQGQLWLQGQIWARDTAWAFELRVVFLAVMVSVFLFCLVWEPFYLGCKSTASPSQQHTSQDARRGAGPGLRVSKSVTRVFPTNLIRLSQHR